MQLFGKVSLFNFTLSLVSQGVVRLDWLWNKVSNDNALFVYLQLCVIQTYNISSTSVLTNLLNGAENRIHGSISIAIVGQKQTRYYVAEVTSALVCHHHLTKSQNTSFADLKYLGSLEHSFCVKYLLKLINAKFYGIFYKKCSKGSQYYVR